MWFDRCKGCDVIFGKGISKPSKEDPNYCDDCIKAESMIEFYCVGQGCGRFIGLFYNTKSMVLRYNVRGNWCPDCNMRAALGSRRIRPEEEGDYTGYLAFMAAALKVGSISKDAFEEAKWLNEHDIKNKRLSSNKE